MSEVHIRMLFDLATKRWEQNRDVSSKERLDEYFKYHKSSKREG